MPSHRVTKPKCTLGGENLMQTNEEAQQWADAMEQRARELAEECFRLRLALENIKNATQPSPLFKDSAQNALLYIDRVAQEALLNRAQETPSVVPTPSISANKNGEPRASDQGRSP